MCIIIIKQKSNTIARSILKNSARINPHGLGVVWLDTFEVSYHKSKEYQLLNTERPFIAHFRYATKGLVNRDNTHPFVCGSNKDELLMMNGTIAELGDATTCDTKVLARMLGNIPRQTWKARLAKYTCRFVTINTRNRSFQIYNKHLYTHKDGVWYSKTNVLQDNLLAVYGTLKKGYSNYNHYLKNSNHIGTGVTASKYPLIIQGLPYLINEKGKGYNVEVDVFSVSDATLSNIDRLEGHPTWYKREEIEVKVNGKTYTCWTYFNLVENSDNKVLHHTYEQSTRLPSVEKFSFEYDDAFGCEEYIVEESPMCANCYQDLEHDGFSNYHCNGCDQWFSENEILTHFNL